MPSPLAAAAVANYAAIAETVTAYSEALCSGDVARIERLIAGIWSCKAITDGAVALETRAQLLSRLRQPPTEPPRSEHLSSIQLCFRDFAVARTDQWDGPACSILLLFQERGVWKVAGEAKVGAGTGQRPRHFSVSDAERQVLDVLGTYYKAVTDGAPNAVRAIFSHCWEMKNHEEIPNGQDLVAEGTEAFAMRLEQGPLPTYWDDRQISDIQVMADRLAYVRIDKPSTPSTTVFLFAREHGAWKIIDKAWTDGRK
jgi:hypothetical protein